MTSTITCISPIDGAMLNSDQCCCGIERIYLHESLFDPETTLGPMADTCVGADAIGARPETGTGCKDTGRGNCLSVLGFHAVTRPKSYHLKKVTS